MSDSNVYFKEPCTNPASFLPPNQDAKPTPNTTHGWEVYHPDGCKQVTYKGRGAAHFKVAKEWGQDAKGDYRNEVTIVKAEEDSRVTETGWYGFRILFPTDGGGEDARKTSHNQWFEDGGNELTLRTLNGYCFLELETTTATGSAVVYQWDLYSNAKTESSTGSQTGFVKHSLEQWDQFTFNIKHHLTSGFIKVYRGDQLVHSYTGPTIHLKIPKWKIGEYSSYTKSTLPYKVVYFSDIVVGNAGATLADMIGTSVVEPPIEPPVTLPPALDEYRIVAGADQSITLPANKATVTAELSGLKAGNYKVIIIATSTDAPEIRDETNVVVTGTTEPIPPTPIPGVLIREWKLINAETEQVVATVVEGGSYSLSALGLRKVNLQVDTDDSVTQVAFVCTGPTPKNSTDKGSPFTLQGDSKRTDGSINYNYGNWGPPAVGAYKVVGTPSVGSSVRNATTINFSIKA